MADKWYYREGPDADVVVSCRVRLARNLSGYPFPGRASRAQLSEMTALCEKACMHLPDMRLLSPEKLSTAEQNALVEKHLASPQFIENPDAHSLALSGDEALSIMIGEEDLLRIQSMGAGNDLENVLARAISADQLLEKELPFAVSAALGYLTHCPTNLGTGLRASVMLHLPAMEETGAVRRLTATAGKLGLAVRGSYGEGSAALGALYQISNQITLGLTEEEIVQKLLSVTTQVIQEERALRLELLSRDKGALCDRVFRALGVLQNAYLLSSEETFSLCSTVRMGLACGLISGISYSSLDALSITAGVGGITLLSGARDSRGRDIARAELCRKTLSSAKGEA